MPGDPEECREHGKRCRRWQAKQKTPKSKTAFGVAQRWTALASDLEATHKLLKAFEETATSLPDKKVDKDVSFGRRPIVDSARLSL